MQDAITVSEFVAAAKAQIEDSAAPAWVAGEVANFTRAASGHWYFTMRDGAAQVDCVMLARQNRLAERAPKAGDKIIVLGAAAMYAPRARFQLAARMLQFDGAGRLHQLFMRRKEQWRLLGWFDNARPLPALPQTVGVVCSTAGAAMHDVLRVLRERCPLPVIIYPAPAQGDGAAEKIAAMIDAASERRECDVLLLVRGGGGIEDLWAYNEEAVVSAVYRCALPVISGIGHDIDETLADYAADRRCTTPTAAAAAAVPERAALLERLDARQKQIRQRLQAAVDDGAQRLDWAQRLLASPQRVIDEKQQRCRRLQQALQAAAAARLAAARHHLQLSGARLPRLSLSPQTAALEAAAARLQQALSAQLTARAEQVEKHARALDLLSPEHLLRRGYSIVTNAAGGAVSSIRQVQGGDRLNVQLSDGRIRSTVDRGDLLDSNR